MKGFHQFCQHFQVLLLEIDKFAAFQLVIFFLQLIAFQDIQKLLAGNIIRGNIQIQESAGHGHPNGNFYSL